MGWKSFFPLFAVGAVVILLVRPGNESLDLHAWSDHLSEREGHTPFVHITSDAAGSSASEAEVAGIRWVHLRIALAAGWGAEADSLARVLMAALPDTTTAAAEARALLGMVSADSVPLSRGRLDETQDALVAYYGHEFEEAAVLETLRRAAESGASRLARKLTRHSFLVDGEGEDILEEHLERLSDLCEGTLTEEELVEMETIVTDILRRRT